MKIEEIIERSIAKKGGRLDLDTVEPALKELLTTQLNRARRAADNLVNQLTSIKSIEVGIIDNYTINAYAIGANGIYFIGLHRGLYATFSLIFSRLFGDKEFMSFVGDVENEKDNLPIIESIFPNFEATIDNLTVFSLPQDLNRREAARLFSWLSFDLILAHELGHIIKGHCDYYLLDKKQHLDELSKPEKTKEAKLERKTLEMDADRWACTMLLSTELNRHLGKLGVPGQSWKHIYERPGMVLLNYAIIVSTVFKIFGDQRLDHKPFDEQNYPVPRLRFIISTHRIAAHPEFKTINKKMKFDLDKNGIPIHVQAAFKIVESGFEIITGKANEVQSALDAKGELGTQQINTLIKHWNSNMIDKLSKYSHIKLFKMKYLNK